jgi:hypothetical protein
MWPPGCSHAGLNAGSPASAQRVDRRLGRELVDACCNATGADGGRRSGRPRGRGTRGGKKTDDDPEEDEPAHRPAPTRWAGVLQPAQPAVSEPAAGFHRQIVAADWPRAPGFGIVPPVRRGVAVMLGLLAVAAPAAAHDVPYLWSVAKVMRVTDDGRVRVGKSVVRIHAETTLCAGQGASRRWRGVRRWRHFVCTYTTFTRRGVGRDLDFRVHVLGVRRFVITDAHWVGETR